MFILPVENILPFDTFHVGVFLNLLKSINATLLIWIDNCTQKGNQIRWPTTRHGNSPGVNYAQNLLEELNFLMDKY